MPLEPPSDLILTPTDDSAGLRFQKENVRVSDLPINISISYIRYACYGCLAHSFYPSAIVHGCEMYYSSNTIGVNCKQLLQLFRVRVCIYLLFMHSQLLSLTRR